jgi:hypothetical protein
MDAPPTPSGKQATGYGQLLIEVWPIGDWASAECRINIPHGQDGREIPFGFLMVACEHLIRATAQRSGAGYEKAIDLLVEGALKSKGKMIR